ncbi:SBBP repeat-containing protein [Chloroflexota bacterium]
MEKGLYTGIEGIPFLYHTCQRFPPDSSTFLGGSGCDYGNSIALDVQGQAYVTGYTDSLNFPILNPYQDTIGGCSDAFVTKLSTSGGSLDYSTYIGGSGCDYGNGIDVGGLGSAYVTGGTDSTDFPTKNAVQEEKAGSTDVFVTKLSSLYGSLTIFKYNDENGNGLHDLGEPGLLGWDFLVIGPLGYSWTGLTDGDGSIALIWLVPGLYTVTETLQLGWICTDPGGSPPWEKAAIVTAGVATVVEFGNQQESLWSPWYYDMNVNGHIEIMEVLIAISDYFDLQITILEALQVISLYFLP